VAQQLYEMTAPGIYIPAGTTKAQGVCQRHAGTSPETAGKWSQQSYAFYLGLETDLTKSLTTALPGAMNTNTFGDAWVGKVNALYKIIPGLDPRQRGHRVPRPRPASRTCRS
jgi:iron complex outermembrane receptor protein